MEKNTSNFIFVYLPCTFYFNHQVVYTLSVFNYIALKIDNIMTKLTHSINMGCQTKQNVKEFLIFFDGSKQIALWFDILTSGLQ